MGHLEVSILLAIAPVLGCASTAPKTDSASPGASPAASLVVRDMDGVERDLAATLESGKKVALVFWQTWCVPCIKEAPALATAARDHHATIDFVGVVSGPDEVVDDAEVREMTEELDLPYPQVRDRDLTLTRRYDVKATPTIIVLGKDARVLYRGHRPPEIWTSL